MEQKPSQPPPDFGIVIEMLKNSDHNLNYFAASKLQSIANLLHMTGQSSSLGDLKSALGQLRTSDCASRWDE